MEAAPRFPALTIAIGGLATPGVQIHPGLTTLTLSVGREVHRLHLNVTRPWWRCTSSVPAGRCGPRCCGVDDRTGVVASRRCKLHDYDADDADTVRSSRPGSSTPRARKWTAQLTTGSGGRAGQHARSRRRRRCGHRVGRDHASAEPPTATIRRRHRRGALVDVDGDHVLRRRRSVSGGGTDARCRPVPAQWFRPATSRRSGTTRLSLVARAGDHQSSARRR